MKVFELINPYTGRAYIVQFMEPIEAAVKNFGLQIGNYPQRWRQKQTEVQNELNAQPGRHNGGQGTGI